MFTLALRNLWARKLRVLLLVATIASGVGFIVGSLVFGETITKSFDDLFSTAYRNTDVVVRGAPLYESDFGTVRDRVPGDVVDEVTRVPGVAGAAGLVQFSLTVLDRTGQPVGTGGAPSFGQTWIALDRASPYRLVAGAAPARDDEVVIDRKLAADGPFALGDAITVLSSSGRSSYSVAGVVTFGEQDSAGGANSVLFTPATAQRLTKAGGAWDEIIVVSTGEVSDEQLAGRIEQALSGRPIQAVTAAAVAKENTDALADALSFIDILLLVFGAISVIVATFVIVNTFAILVSQRLRELALLRALGASAEQVRRSVLLEATAIGILGSLAGVGFGLVLALGIKALFAAFGADLPATGLVLTPAMVVVGFVVGIVSTVGAAYLPARKASRVPPIAALRDAALPPARTTVARIAAGAALAVIAGAALASGLAGGEIALVGVASLAAIVAMATLAPLFARALARLLGAPLTRLRGITGTLARENASRSPRRTASTAMALAVGAMLVSFLLVLSASITASVGALVDRDITADFTIDQKTFGPGFPTSVAAEARAVTGVATVTPYRQTQALIGGRVVRIVATDAATFPQVVRLGTITGDLRSLGTDGLAVRADTAATKGWSLGTPVEVTSATGTTTLTVRALYAPKNLADITGDYLVDLAYADQASNDPLDFLLFVRLADGATEAQVRPGLEAVVRQTPTLVLQNREEFKDSRAQRINQILVLFNALLALAILIAGLGIANTLSLSIHERRRELGLLRAVGQTKAQTRSMVRWEGAIIGILGAVLGVALGLVFGIAVVNALGDQGISELAIPASLVVVLVLGALFGVAASWRPARRAARLDILQAIGSE